MRLGFQVEALLVDDNEMRKALAGIYYEDKRPNRSTKVKKCTKCKKKVSLSAFTYSLSTGKTLGVCNFCNPWPAYRNYRERKLQEEINKNSA